MIIRSPSFIALLSLSTSLELVSKISAHDIFVEESPEVEASQSVFSSNLLPPVETEDDDEDNHRYIIKFVDDSPVFLNRLDNARRKLADDSGRIRDHFIPFENAEIAYLKSEKEVEDWENNIEVEYVIKGKENASFIIHQFIFIAANYSKNNDSICRYEGISPRRGYTRRNSSSECS